MRFVVDGLAVSVGQPPERLLAGVAFTLEAGDAVALRGRSGLGKTTLLRTLAALHADPGEAVRFDGETAEVVGTPRWRRRVTYVPQAPVMHPGTVRENLARSFAFGVAEEPFPEERAERWLAELGLRDGVLAREARSLSGGEQHSRNRTVAPADHVVLVVPERRHQRGRVVGVLLVKVDWEVASRGTRLAVAARVERDDLHRLG